MNHKMVVPKTSKKYAWIVLGMLWLICFLNYADRQAIFSIFPVLEKNFSFSKWQLGLLGSSFLWVYAASALVAGFCVDRWPRKYFILGGCFFWSLVTMSTGMCTQLWQFIAVRGLEGLGESFYFPASNSLLADYHGGKTRSLSFALHLSGITGGTIAGSTLGAWLAQYYGWQYGFYFFGGLGVVLSFILFFFLKEPRRGAMDSFQESFFKTLDRVLAPQEVFWALIKRPIYLLLVITFAGMSFVNAIFMVWMPLFLYEKFHCSLAVAGFSGVTFIQVAALIMTLSGGWFSDYLAERTKNNRLLIQAVSLLSGACVMATMTKMNSFMSFIIGMVGYGICKGTYDGGGLAAIFDQVEPKLRGSALGVSVTLGALGGALGPIFVGALSSHKQNGMTQAIFWSAAIYFVGGAATLIAFLLAERKRKV